MRASWFPLAAVVDEEEKLRWAHQRSLDFQQPENRMWPGSHVVQRIQKETQASAALVLSFVMKRFCPRSSLPMFSPRWLCPLQLSLTRDLQGQSGLKETQTVIKWGLQLEPSMVATKKVALGCLCTFTRSLNTCEVNGLSSCQAWLCSCYRKRPCIGHNLWAFVKKVKQPKGTNRMLNPLSSVLHCVATGVWQYSAHGPGGKFYFLTHSFIHLAVPEPGTGI